MTHTIRFAAAALLVALAPHGARADTPPLSAVQVYCQPGSLNNCFAFAFSSADGHITYYLQNLQGSIAPDGSPFAIRQILLEDRAATQASGLDMHFREITPSGAPIANVTTLFSLDGSVRRDKSDLYIDSNALPYLQRIYLANTGAIYGCDTPYTGPDGDFFQTEFSIAQTCIPSGLDGFLRFDATAFLYDTHGNLIRPGSMDDLYVNIQGCNVHIGASSGGSAARGTDCSTNISYASLHATVTTAPEPTTLVLLATGLTGTGLLKRRRRRQNTM